jgi:hypothetical protein
MRKIQIRIKNNDSRLAAAARLEAMMTYMQRQIGDRDADFLYLEHRIAKSKEQTFNFGRIFGATLRELEAGIRKLPREIEEMFT